VSYPILGKPLVSYVLDAIKPLEIDETVVVVGFGGETTTSIVQDRAKTVWQHELLGTGHALMQAEDILAGKEGITLVLCGDTPLLTSDTLQKLVKKHVNSKANLTLLTAVLDNPKGYGRIIRDKTNSVVAIREDKDCTSEEALVYEINAGVYVFDNSKLFEYLKSLKNNNAQNEYYLTDLIELFVKNNLKVEAYIVEDAVEIFGINDRVQLSYAAKVLKKRINQKLMLSLLQPLVENLN
jgi:bifunctional UDP-N-acetylglucosamine pyrophosphorylase/glucosamine-1-phosphate N-acetyltransferase